MNVMFDLETYANTSNAAIIQIAAVEFDDKSGDILRKFNMNVDVQSCLDLGMEMNVDTINWWMEQSDEARKSILRPGQHIGDALNSFRDFLHKPMGKDEEFRLWCHATFDEPILSNAYRKAGMYEPWEFRSVRDLRTLIDLAEIDPKTYQNGGTYHDALDDCKFQVRYTVDALNKLRGVK